MLLIRGGQRDIDYVVHAMYRLRVMLKKTTNMALNPSSVLYEFITDNKTKYLVPNHSSASTISKTEHSTSRHFFIRFRTS